MFVKSDESNALFSVYLKERFAFVAFLSRLFKKNDSLSFVFFVNANPKVWYNFVSPVFSFPPLKKTDSLFHKELIALVFEKVKTSMCSFCSIVALLKDKQEIAIVAL